MMLEWTKVVAMELEKRKVDLFAACWWIAYRK